MSGASPTRMAVVWCPDWPVAIWGVPADEPAAVFVSNRAVACSRAAREDGVAVGMRRREAQGRCPDLAVLERDIDREARLFEPVVRALDDVSAVVEVSEPGLAGFPTRGPARFFGGDEALAEHMIEVVDPVVPRRASFRVALADGSFAARLAAQGWRTADDGGRAASVVLPAGATPDFLAPLPVSTLGVPALVDVLERLGLRTLRAFADLEAGDVSGRFGREGLQAHRLARGWDEHPLDLRRPAPDLSVHWQFDPPAERIEACALVARHLADDLHRNLAEQGLACVRLGIEARDADGREFFRLWRHDGVLDAAAVAERTRWQLDAWIQAGRRADAAGSGADGGLAGSGADDGGLAGSGADGSGVAYLCLIPDEVIPAHGRQLGMWGDRTRRADDVARAVTRVQTLVGVDAVRVAEWCGGRHPAEQLRLIPAAAVDFSQERRVGPGPDEEPWPDRIPDPAPARVSADPAVVRLDDALGHPVVVSGRGELLADPALLIINTRSSRVVAWAGPWPADERWWDPFTQCRRARLQVVLDDGTAHLVAVEQGQWFLEATYD